MIVPTNPIEDTPKQNPGESLIDYAKRATRWMREQQKQPETQKISDRKAGEDFLDYIDRLWKSKEQQKEVSETQPANDGGKNMVEMEQKEIRTDKYYKVLVTIFLVCLLFILSIIAFNGRYIGTGSGAYIFDKWKKELLVPNHEPIKY